MGGKNSQALENHRPGSYPVSATFWGYDIGKYFFELSCALLKIREIITASENVLALNPATLLLGI